MTFQSCNDSDLAKAIGESTAMLSPIAACFSMLDDETYAIMKQKFDICYLMAKESIPFVKYPAVQELETELGVNLGLHIAHLLLHSILQATLLKCFVQLLWTNSLYAAYLSYIRTPQRSLAAVTVALAK